LLVKTDGDTAANTTYSIDVEKLVERGGKRELRVSQADMQTKAAEAQLKDTLRQQMFELKQAFLAAVLARENFRVLRENLNDFHRTQQLLTAQVREGYTAGVDLRRIELEEVGFQGGVSEAQRNFVQSLRDVLNLIGEGEAAPAGAAIEIASASLTSLPDRAFDALDGDLSVMPVSIEAIDLRALALANRPDLEAAQLQLDAADVALRLAQAERIRDVTLGGQFARSGSDNAVGVAVGVPLTTHTRANAATAQATAARLQAEARLRQVRAQVLTDVEKALAAYRVSRDRLRLFDGQVLRNAAEVRDIERVAYREGARALLSFLDAQRAYNQTLLGYNQARHDLALSIFQLELAAGAPLAN
jgi:cobalt-zinc-cadmium efflux system outer membrane protein